MAEITWELFERQEEVQSVPPLQAYCPQVRDRATARLR